MNRCSEYVFERLSSGQVLVILLRKTRTIVRPRNYGFKTQPSPDIDGTELPHGLARRAIEICNTIRERSGKSRGEKSIQYTAARNRRNGGELRQNAEFVQSAEGTKMEESCPVSPSRQTQ